MLLPKKSILSILPVIILITASLNLAFGQGGTNAFRASQMIAKLDEDQLNSTLKKFVADPFEQTKILFGKDVLKNDLSFLFDSNFETSSSGVQSIFSPEKQTLILDATAQIIAEQFREGVTKLYLDKLKKKFDSIEELQGLFPQTFDLLDKSSPFDFPDLGNDFKKAFEEDLNNLPTNLVKLIDESEKDVFTGWRAKKWYPPVKISFDIGEKLIAGYHPVEVLNYLDQRYESPIYDGENEINERLKDYHKYIRLINVVQYNFQDLDKKNLETESLFKNLWINFSSLKQLDTKDEIVYFIALIYHQLPIEIQDDFKRFLGISDARSMRSLSEIQIKKIYNECLVPFLEIFHKMESLTADGISNPEEVGLLLKYTLQAFELVYSKVGNEDESIEIGIDELKIDELVNLTKKGMGIYSSIIDKNYGKIVPDLVYIIKFIAQGNNGVVANSNLLELINSLRRYGALIEAVAKAETSGEMKEVIKKEITSFDYLKKRSSLSSLTLSAHPGIFAAQERLYDKTTERDKYLLGLTAPIGIEWALGIRKSSDQKGSSKYLHYANGSNIKTLSGATLGLFVQILDLGAVVNYRIKDSDSELPDNVTFKEVFSPGAAVHYGFRNSPITLGFGYQYTPELREVTVGGTTSESNAGRVFMRLTWDINLIRFYSKMSK